MTLNTQELISTLNWRYATKTFDSQKKIDADTWAKIEEALRLAPSSYGLQPYKFLTIENPDLRAKLKEQSWNQTQVTDASHLVVFAIRKSIDEQYVTNFIQNASTLRNIDINSLDGYKNMMIANVVKGLDATSFQAWASRQAYIALGQAMVSSALLKIDTCALEGLNPSAYDDILGLESKGLKTVVACAFGYRSADDKYASFPKVRLSSENIFERY